MDNERKAAMERLRQLESWTTLPAMQEALHMALEDMERVEAYEDTGMEPEEIVRMGMAWEDSKRYSGRLEGKLKAYEQAKQDGRLVVLKCDPNAVFWQIHGEVLAVSRFDGFTITCDGEMRWYDGLRYYTEEDFGKTVFLTRAEAEAALKKED